ncbi:acyl-CoA dehydrogenase family protein [Streptomyces blattellae]|uniref:acyl-CoA dehydrogenase n=1 Tax=Streptomyces blattellae TaxID=2569855 RepID=UPI0018ACF43A|nr:acyl-CoA dehydrogenase [Streptomyces blattellae]
MTPDNPPATAPLDDRASDLLGRARKLGLLAEEHTQESMRERRLVDVVEKELLDGGLIDLWVPRSLGGAECPPLDMYDVIEETSYHDGAAGWVLLAIVLATATSGAYLGDSAVAELFGGGGSPVMAGQGSPVGRAEVVEGGYLLSGRWSYGSGIKHTTHAYSGATVFENGSPKLDATGRPALLLTVVPREFVTFGDNWDVLGLSATGSIDYSISERFVPAEWTHPARIRHSDRGGSLYSLGVMGMGCLLHAAWAAGLGRRVLDELAVYARHRGDRSAGDDFVQRAARAEGSFRAASAYLRNTWVDVQRTFERGEELSNRQQTTMRLAVNHITHTVADVCEQVYRISGGVGLRAGAIQRCFRDANASVQHIIVSDVILRGIGRELLGLAPDHGWVHHELVPNHV